MTKRTKPGSDWRVACGARLRQAREAVPLTQAELAATLDVRQQAVSRWERGDAAPRDALRPRIARLVGRPAAELFAYSEPARYRVSALVAGTGPWSASPRVERWPAGRSPPGWGSPKPGCTTISSGRIGSGSGGRGRRTEMVDFNDPVQVEEILAAVLAAREEALARDREAQREMSAATSALITVQVGLEHLLQTQLEDLYAEGS